MEDIAFKLDASDEQTVLAACEMLSCTRDDLMLAINVVGPDIDALAQRLLTTRARSALWEDPAPDLLQDGQEEVFSRRAVELGLDYDPPALPPPSDGET
ncbi:hypothetical protein LJR164_004557 [Phenylobacterium sp. LjRoot164]|uniref:hypothetical protein n=1 Tax=unclassified Phenylobacterium TaxID=2640670 RepID=UPI003ED0BA33